MAIITSIGLTGIASRFSIVPRSRSLVIAIVVTNRVENISTMQTRPGHDVEHGQLLGIVAGVHDELERRGLRLQLPDRRQVAVEVVRHLPERRNRVADGGRVGRVGVDQHARLLAAVDRPVEVGRHLDDEDKSPRASPSSASASLRTTGCRSSRNC